MAELIDETKFLPALGRILDCVSAEVEEYSKLCFSGITPAGRPPLGVMNCGGSGCGVLWVSPVTAFPSAAFPTPDEGNETVSNVTSPLAMEVEIGIARCYPNPRGNDAQADPQEYFEATRLYLADMAAVRRGLECCFQAKDSPTRNMRYAIGPWISMEPEARAGGGTWQIWIG